MSAILSVDDLNDFITPGVACIKPVETLPAEPALDPLLANEVIRDGTPAAAAAGGAGPAQISLTDCLACSGCVTSAEAVLVSLQSHAEVLRTLDAAPALRLVAEAGAPGGYTVEGLDDPARRLFVASVAPQVRANLAAACGPRVSEREAGCMLEQLLTAGSGAHGNGFTWVVDTSAARDAALVLGADEVLDAPLPHSCQKKHADAPQPRPLLTSSCPGWVCYAEKTHPHVLGHLSKVKSPQALTGTLLKTTLSRTLGIPPDRIWHLAVMPCFDKKLEASREELTDAVWGATCSGDCSGGSKSAHAHAHRGVRDVDCVITSKEVLMLAESRGIDFFSLPRKRLSTAMSRMPPPFPDPVLARFLFPPHRRARPSAAAGSSGGNLYFVLQSVLARHPGATLHTNRGRNVDVVEYIITAPDADGTPLFKAARYYGFRNIQNLVRRLRPARPSRLPGGRPIGSARRKPTGGAGAGAGAGLDYACIEVMACPGGCTNGGGQVKIDDPIVMARRGLTSKPGPLEQKAWLAEIDEAYYSAEDDTVDDVDLDLDHDDDEIDGIRPAYVRETLAHWARITGIDLRRLAYTSFREVVSDIGKAKNGDDTAERVVQLAGKIGGGW